MQPLILLGFLVWSLPTGFIGPILFKMVQEFQYRSEVESPLVLVLDQVNLLLVAPLRPVIRQECLLLLHLLLHVGKSLLLSFLWMIFLHHLLTRRHQAFQKSFQNQVLIIIVNLIEHCLFGHL